MATIGYGTGDYFFGDCWGPLIIVTLQVVTALVMDSLVIGVVFQRMSQGQSRSSTIAFSDSAVLRRVRGQLYVLFRVMSSPVPVCVCVCVMKCCCCGCCRCCCCCRCVR